MRRRTAVSTGYRTQTSSKQQELDPDGHHYKRYAATVENVTVTFDDGDYEVAVTRSTDPADRFTDLFEGLS